jgi:hypothetical protein
LALLQFQQFGGSGTYVRDYSQGGAYVVAGSGGHTGPGYTGALIFDFEDATWKRLDNANGIANSSATIDPTAVNAEGELSAASSGQIPAPYHVYALAFALSTANGGGSKGSFACAYRASETTSANSFFRSMKMDLSSGLWTRFSTNLVTDGGGGSYGDNGSSAYDPTLNCIWALPVQIHAAQQVSKLPLSSPTWVSSAPDYAFPADRGQNRNCFVYDSARLLVAGTALGGLRALNLNSIASGWTDLTVSGTLPSHDVTWARYPGNGRWYTRETTGSVFELTPPASSPLSNTWTVTTVTFTGATIPDAPDRANGSVPNTRFLYVSAIDCLAWIAGDTQNVVIMRP